MGFLEKLFSKKSKPQAFEPDTMPEPPKEPEPQAVQEDKAARIVIDDEFINSMTDPFTVVEHMERSVNISDGIPAYEDTLKSFSLPQRYVFAITNYIREINNGGHDQFFFNSSGILWQDALKGFALMGAHKNANILKQAGERLGGAPSRDQDERQDALEELEPDFDDLDDLYYAYEAETMGVLLRYIRANAKDFYYSES